MKPADPSIAFGRGPTATRRVNSRLAKIIRRHRQWVKEQTDAEPAEKDDEP